MTALNPLAVQNAALLRELGKEGPAETVSAIARRIGRDESNVRKSIKLLIAEGLAQDPMCLTVEGGLQVAAIDRAEGRGEDKPGSSEVGDIRLIAHAQIFPDHANARADWDSDEARMELDALRGDILELGLLQNLVVRPDDFGGTIKVLNDKDEEQPLYTLVGGERRWRAIGLAISEGDWPEDRLIPCRVVDLDTLGQRLAALSENLQRRNLNPLEKAKAFEGLAKAFSEQGVEDDKLNREIADRVGVTIEHVQQHRSFLKLDEADQQRLTLPKDDPRRLSVREARQKISRKSAEPELRQLAPLARLAWVELTDAAYRRGKYSNLWNSVVVAPDAATSPEGLALAEIGAITFEGIQKYNNVGRFTAKRHYDANTVRLDPPLPAGLLMGDEARTEALRDEQRLALGDAAPEWPEGDVAYATPWLADPGELTPEGLAMVEADQAEARARDEAENARQAAIAARDIRWREARQLHLELFAEAAAKPVWGIPEKTVEIAAAIDRPLPWFVTEHGAVIDAAGARVAVFGHYQGCSDQGLVTARMIVAAVNAAGGLATPAAPPADDAEDDPEQDIDGNDPDAELDADDAAEAEAETVAA